MQTRTVAAALFASSIVGLVAVFGGGAAAQSEECLAGPKGPTPAGGHWYYRVDRATHRNCWYLKDDGAGGAKPDPASAQAGADEAPAAEAATEPAQPAVSPTSAEAHAELVTPRPRKPRTDTKTDAAKPVAAKPVDSGPAAKSDGSGAIAEAPRDGAQLVKVSDATAPATDGANSAAPAPNAAPPDAQAAPPENSPTGAAPSAPPPAADALRDGTATQGTVVSAAPKARGDGGIGPLRMFLGLALIGAGLSIMLACLVFHLMYGTIAFPEQGEAGQLTDLL